MYKKQLLKELVLLSSIVIVAVFSRLILLPVFLGNAALDINLHDTYYLHSLPDLLWMIIALICFAIYLLRSIFSGFRNSLLLLILGISTIFIIIWLDTKGQAYMNYLETKKLLQTILSEQKQMVTDPSDKSVTGLFYGGSDAFVTQQSFSLPVLQIILILFVGFLGFAIGSNVNRKDKLKSVDQD